jgi:glycosyltransferase involved in cell wall biosynthesis
MIRVGLDTSVLAGFSGVRGVGKYTAQLLPALRATKKVKVVEFKDRFNLNSVDLIHYPYFDFFFLTLPFFKKKKTVVTVHDCTPLVLPQSYPPGVRGKIKFYLQRMSLKGVSAVIADSESSKKDIVRFLGVPEKKIKVIYLAADRQYQKISQSGKWPSLIRKKYNPGENFILYVGDINPNKNLPRLIRTFAGLPQDYNLVLVGKAFKNPRLAEVKSLNWLIRELGLQKRIRFPGFVPDKELVKIYNLAKVFCLPSLYEGFGFPILEAMACGCPVVTANTSSMPEVAGEAAVLVDPNSEKSILEGLRKIIENSDLRNQLIDKGFKRAEEFSWQKTAQETIAVYREVLGQ